MNFEEMEWGKIVIPVLVILGGLFAIFCSIKNYDWFMEHRKAQMLAAVLGRNGTRVFYALLGLALVTVGLVVMLNPPVVPPGLD